MIYMPVCKKTAEQIFKMLILKFFGKFLKFYIWTSICEAAAALHRPTDLTGLIVIF